MEQLYDVIVIGAGPAGLATSIYLSCFKLRHLTLATLTGGQMTLAPDILNYPGFSEISGMQLADRMTEQLQKRGGDVHTATVTAIQKKDHGFILQTEDEKTFHTKTIVVATGVERRKLGVPGEKEYAGKGVQYCAVCERFDYENRTVVVVGAANAAAQTAMQLAGAAKQVTMLCRGDGLTCDEIWKEKINQTNIINIVTHVQVKEICGDKKHVTHIKVQPETGKIYDMPAGRLFIEIGGVPQTELLTPLGVKMDTKGFVDVDYALQTSVPGMFACGDVISNNFSIEQISSAVGTGATVAKHVLSYLKQAKA